MGFPFVTLTGQRSKLVVICALAVAAVTVLLNIDLIGEATGWNSAVFVAVLLALDCFGILAFVYLLRSVRCPTCGARIVWEWISGTARDTRLVSLVRLASCPHCNYTPTSESRAALQNQ